MKFDVIDILLMLLVAAIVGASCWAVAELTLIYQQEVP